MRPPDARRVIPAAAVLVTLLIGCSSAGSTPSAPAGTPSPAASSAAPAAGSLLFRISADGGFVPSGFIVTRLPQLSVYADGRALEPGAVPAIYPGPPVSPLILHRLDSAAVAAVRTAAIAAGLAGPDRTYTNAQVADVETTVFTYVDAAGPHTLSIYALGSPPRPAASSEEHAARAAAATLVRKVQDIVAGVPGSTTYSPAAYRIYAVPADAQPTGQPAPNVLAWPAALPTLAGLPAIPVPPGARCGIIQEGDLAAFTGLLSRATQITRYVQAGTEWTLLIRPLLPDEGRTCR